MNYVTYTDRYQHSELCTHGTRYDAVLELVMQDVAVLERQTSHVLQQGVGDEARVIMSALCGAVRILLRFHYNARPDHTEELS